MTNIWLKVCVSVLAGSALLAASSLALLARRAIGAAEMAAHASSGCGPLIPVPMSG
ncbi:hypothetical protein [Novosphingobium sp.]|uniref:hypothetical protein n=2 Tax=Novosphingobium TaxID=165696 RepID=UPI0038BD227C